MSQHHIAALAALANMRYIASEIHARTPIEQDGVTMLDHLDEARNHLQHSMLRSNSGDPLQSLLSLKATYTNTNKGMNLLQSELNKHGQAALNGEGSQSNILKSLEDTNAYAEHQQNFMGHAKNIIEHENSKVQGIRDMQDNARNVIEGVADDNNLLLPGSWVNKGDNEAPNGE
jgi:hypothetical protein